MDNQEPQEFEFSLDDIIREFRDEPEAEAEPESPVQTEPSVNLSDDTVRIDTDALPKGSYTNAVPIDDEAEEIPEEILEETPVEDTSAEPFSDRWEPEYEQPMGKYIPPQPILIHPQSRLRELKKKLVAGPEKRYYQLTEKGTGKLQALLLISLLISLVCIVTTVLFHFGLVPQSRLRLMIFGQLLCMLVSALLGSSVLVEGMADIVRKRFSLNSLLIFSLLFCCIDGVLCLRQLRVPCCCAFTLQIFLSLWDCLYRRRTEISQMDTLRKANNLTAIRPSAEPVDGATVLTRGEGQVEDFMDSYWIPSKPEKVRSYYALGALIASVAVGAVGWVMHGISTGIQIAAVTVLAAVPASFFVCLSRPAAILQDRLHKLGAVLCGWRGISVASRKALFPIRHADLFPAGALKMNGVKFFGSRDPDEVVAYATALIQADNNGLSPLFTQVLESRNCHHMAVQQLQTHRGGLSGTVRGESVLVGTLSFLQEHQVEIPDGLHVSHAVCVAVDGVLSGLFAISYEKTRSAAGGLHTLCAYRGLTPVLLDGDFLLTSGYLRAKFGFTPKHLVIADGELRNSLTQLETDPVQPAAVLMTNSTLSAAAYGVTGARALQKASYLGLFLHMVGGIIGIGIMLTLTIIGATELLSPLPVLLYQLVWSVPGLLFTEWSRLV